MIARSQGKAAPVSVVGIDEKKSLQTRSFKAGLQVRLLPASRLVFVAGTLLFCLTPSPVS